MPCVRSASIMKRFFLFSVFLVFPVGSNAFAQLGEWYRPSIVQQEVDAAYERIEREEYNSWKTRTDGVPSRGWAFNGDGFYNLMGFDERKLIHDIALSKPSKKDIYLVDLGAASGGWGDQAERYINSELTDSDQHFHIFSITGFEELKQEQVTVGKVTHYRINRFKIENLLSELKKRKLTDLVGKVDLLVSNWTLRHLVDPFGTLEQMYSLLTPAAGILMSNGFHFVLRDTSGQADLDERRDEKIRSMRGFWQVFNHSSAEYVFKRWEYEGDLDQFMLVKRNTKPLSLPLTYVGNVGVSQGRPKWIASERVCYYQMTSELFEGSPKGMLWQVKEGRRGLRDTRYYGSPASGALFDRMGLRDWLVLPRAAL